MERIFSSRLLTCISFSNDICSSRSETSDSDASTEREDTRASASKDSPSVARVKRLTEVERLQEIEKQRWV